MARRLGALEHGEPPARSLASAEAGIELWDWERFASGVPLGFDAIHFLAQPVKELRTDALEDSEETFLTQVRALAGERGWGDPELLLTTYLLELASRFVVSDPRHSRATWALGLVERLSGAGSVSGVTGVSPVQRMARAGGMSVVGAGAGALLGILLVATITNGLGKGVAGLVFSVTSLFLIAASVVQLGADVGLVRWMPLRLATGEGRQVRPLLRTALLPALAASVALGGAGAWLAPNLAELMADGRDVETVRVLILILAPSLPVVALYHVVLAGTRGFRSMRPTVVVESLGRAALQVLAVAIAVLALRTDAPGVVIAWSFPYLVALVVSGVWLGRLLRPVEKAVRADPLPPRLAREFWHYTTPRAVASVLQAMLKRSDIILVAALRSPAEAALYTAATRFVVLGQLGVQAVQQALAPQLSALFARHEHEAAQQVYRVATAWSMALAWPLYIACAVLAPQLLRLFGPGYEQAAIVVVLLSSAMLAATAAGAVDTVLLMSGRSWLSLANTGSALAVNVVLNLLLIPPFGITGAAVSWAVAIVLRNLLPLLQIRRFLGMSPFGRGAGLVALAALGTMAVAPAVLVVLEVGTGWVVAALVVGGAAYAALLLRASEALHLPDLASALTSAVKRRR